MRIKKGDTVKVLTGKDRGKTGKILVVHRDAGTVLVEGLNLAKKRMRPKRQNEKGQTVELPRPVHASNVMLVCPNCKAATRVGVRVEEKESYRACKRCGARIA